MDPVTMMVASIGMQFFNNYANNKKNAEIQAKQREFQKAAAEHDFERMRKLQAESAKLALELEAEFHQERMKDIDKNYDELLKDFANSFTIENWPLSVLPFIMKGESFGSLFIGTAKSVNMHCIFTPSNCDWFNEMFYDDIDLRLEAEMNNNWNAQTTHPIVYYGGGWNRRTMSKGRSIPKRIDTVDIDLLKVGLKNVPIVVITPYFDPWLHFNVYLWGMGDDKDKPFRIDVSHGEEVEHTRRIFSYEYNKDMEKSDMSDEFINTTIEEFVPYLESLIGFLADKYFWSMYGVNPNLPNLFLRNKSLAIMKNNFSNRYFQMLTSTVEGDSKYVSNEKLLSLFAGIKDMMSNKEQMQYLHGVLDAIARKKGCSEFDKDAFKETLSLEDTHFIDNLIKEIPDGEIKNFFCDILENFKSKIPCFIAEEEDITFIDILDYARQLMELKNNGNIKIQLNENIVVISILDIDGETIISDTKSPKCIILYYKNLHIADRLKLNSSTIIINKDEFDSLYYKIIKLY